MNSSSADRFCRLAAIGLAAGRRRRGVVGAPGPSHVRPWWSPRSWPGCGPPAPSSWRCADPSGRISPVVAAIALGIAGSSHGWAVASAALPALLAVLLVVTPDGRVALRSGWVVIGAAAVGWAVTAPTVGSPHGWDAHRGPGRRVGRSRERRGPRIPGPLSRRRASRTSPPAVAGLGDRGRRHHLARRPGTGRDRRLSAPAGTRRPRRHHAGPVRPRGRHLRRRHSPGGSPSGPHDRGGRNGGSGGGHLSAGGDRTGPRADYQRPQGPHLVDVGGRDRGPVEHPGPPPAGGGGQSTGLRRPAGPRRAPADLRRTHVARRAARRTVAAAGGVAAQEPGSLVGRGVDGHRRRARSRRLGASSRPRRASCCRPTS